MSYRFIFVSKFQVARVLYPGLTSHPQHEVAKRQMKPGYGGMMSVEVKGGVEGGRIFVEVSSVPCQQLYYRQLFFNRNWITEAIQLRQRQTRDFGNLCFFNL